MSFSDPHIRPVMKGTVHKIYLFTAFIYNDITKRIRKQAKKRYLYYAGDKDIKHFWNSF